MRFDKRITISSDTFPDWEGAHFICIDFKENGVIVHYIKDGTAFSYGAASLDNAIKQWELHML